MTTPSPFGVAQSPRAPASAEVVPTWRDLPEEPPYGPVLPPRTPNLGMVFPTVAVEQDAAITPGQIAMAVGGTLLLVAIGIGAALVLLNDDDTPVADVSPVATPRDPIPEDEFPIPPPVSQQPAPDAPQGELQPPPDAPTDPPSPGGEDEVPGGQAPDDAIPEGGTGGSDPGPVPDGSAPGQPMPPPGPLPPQATPEAGEEGSVELPRLFRLRTLPSGTAEEATTVRQTTRGDEVLTEQVTMLSAEGGEIGVRASRDAEAAQRLEDLIADGAEEISVRGVPAHLIDGQRLVWLVPGEEETLIEIEAPPSTGTEALLTIANGLELLR